MKKLVMGMAALVGLGLLAVPGVTGQEAFIRELSGTVEIQAPGGSGWVPARAGQRLEQAALISTGFRSSAVLVIGNSALTVRPLTRLSLEELLIRDGNERVNINLRAGRVRADVAPPARGRTDFSVRGPVITASVRGTSFEFDGVQVQVEEGRVYASGVSLGGAYVGAGHEARAYTEEGRIAGPAETVREELEPPLPAGMDRAAESSRAAVTSADMEAGFDWN